MGELKPQLLLSLREYSKQAFMKDLISGVIVAIIALPLSIALALASGAAAIAYTLQALAQDGGHIVAQKTI